ncbi:MAG: urease accessory protein UreG, partial [Sciscionella sp.]
GGPGVRRSDLLMINKTDLAGMVGADLDVMRADAEAQRGELPTVLLSLREDPGASPVATWVRSAVAVRVTG